MRSPETSLAPSLSHASPDSRIRPPACTSYSMVSRACPRSGVPAARCCSKRDRPPRAARRAALAIRSCSSARSHQTRAPWLSRMHVAVENPAAVVEVEPRRHRSDRRVTLMAPWRMRSARNVSRLFAAGRIRDGVGIRDRWAGASRVARARFRRPPMRVPAMQRRQAGAAERCRRVSGHSVPLTSDSSSRRSSAEGRAHADGVDSRCPRSRS